MSDQVFDEITSSTSDSIWSRMSWPIQHELRYLTASVLNRFLTKDCGSDIPSLASVSYSAKHKRQKCIIYDDFDATGVSGLNLPPWPSKQYIPVICHTSPTFYSITSPQSPHDHLTVTYFQFRGTTFHLILVPFVSLHQRYGTPYLLIFCNVKLLILLDII